MLVLSRRTDESIVINGNIEILICSVRGDKVRLGINAPRDVPVHRKEIQARLDAKEKEKEKTNGVITNLPSSTP